MATIVEENKKRCNMTLEELQKAFVDIAGKREAYPEDSTCKEALALDQKFLLVNDAKGGLEVLLKRLKKFIMNDTVRKERFTDIEICNEDDNLYANEVIDSLLVEFTWNKCKKYLEDEGIDLCEFKKEV